MLYNKPAITIEDQIKQLKSRGLVIEDHDFAYHHLRQIGYYRLAGYWWPMQDDHENHTFKENSTFENVVRIYNFDRELKLLLFDIIEKIEISLRTSLVYHLSLDYDPWWFQNFDLFENSKELVKTLYTLEEEVTRSKETFIRVHKKKYKDDLRFPPSWKTLEMASFGSLSKLYGNLKNSVATKDTIAEFYGAVNHTYLPSWLQSIAQIRNFCAHHTRLWNKNLPGTPKLLSKPPHPWVSDVPRQLERLYVHMCLMKYMLNVIQPQNHFTKRLQALMVKYENIDPNALGLKPDWENEPLWIVSELFEYSDLACNYETVMCVI